MVVAEHIRATFNMESPMTRVFIGVLLLLLGAPSRAPAQAPTTRTDTVYVGGSRSPLVAGLLEASLPFVGYVYAGAPLRGYLPNALRFVSLIGMATTAGGGTDTTADSDCNWKCTAWVLTFAGSTVWAVLGAADAARDHNGPMRQRTVRPLLVPTSAGGLALGIRIVR